MARKPLRMMSMMSMMLTVAALATLPAPAVAQQAVALVGEVTVTPADLDAFAKDRLTRLRNEEYTIRRQALDDYIARLLIEKEAARRGLCILRCASVNGSAHV